MPKPIQLTDDAFLMLRKAVANVEAPRGLRLDAAGIVPAAELVEAEYAAVLDAEGQVELRTTPAGIKYLKAIDALAPRGFGR